MLWRVSMCSYLACALHEAFEHGLQEIANRVEVAASSHGEDQLSQVVVKITVMSCHLDL